MADEQWVCTGWEVVEGRSSQAGGAGNSTWDGPGRSAPDWGRGGCLHLHPGTSLSAQGLSGVQIYSPFCLHPFSNPDPDCAVSLAELDAEHAQKVLEMEHTQQAKLKERQKFFEEAFQQDMEQYLSTGYLQIAERRGKWGTGLLAAGTLPGGTETVLHCAPRAGHGEQSPELKVAMSWHICLIVVFASCCSSRL